MELDPPHPSEAASGQKQSLPTRERAFQQGLAAARAFYEREGHLRVPQRHSEEIEGRTVRLGQWLTNVRRRRTRLSQQRQDALAELGL
ncbi:helicase associated domain-containing protein [Streptomyces sp. 8ZJF_21]|uniref:helicase associated domain-containing protein n=1 Tax=Streptomyces sp. 8ZJF_21 TaxID=2903141 RepID=UPI0027E44690|nr:helicase associated domain-containing protein [Streptomyces sp. 8ZJF_21]